ncbi:tRNA (adenosine(37)-N6)-threonylcarbamoyltransferase complex dimerization subunit type 1 TsaB [Hoeflea sp.]|uniref:tRNA (adenosine(37)-N6)-threonylcarbamoyltransferase complex dimerization subunit type 1 TsaB n=1 Tax=Hoeflea sp. TaxID=1940281 RepID=UPI00198D920E|nr:tRNA (adenosine(37)-N6)-threonylcarbamoyltransferase complex dimerization subunit type 1 TsaB [Hoeflea sp.]MBC7282860.1 tRNA (adenosine(37)-N6)-threonylcarbamoyltransferase complex dimerization subunit type 1 TsaB [Hoeflea sp.]
MLTLALDCSARFCSVAVYEADTDRILGSASPDIGRGHAEQLPAIVEAVLAEAGTDLIRIGRVGVTIGPGSFAGIRVGVSFARGLALALGAPCVGVGSLEAIAIPAARKSGRPVMAVLDARRDHVWAMLLDSRGEVLNPAAELMPAAAAALARESDCGLIGSGAFLLSGIEASLASRIIADPAAPKIEDVARIGARLDPDANPPEPRYLRDADAKPQSGFAVAHEGAG